MIEGIVAIGTIDTIVAIGTIDTIDTIETIAGEADHGSTSVVRGA